MTAVLNHSDEVSGTTILANGTKVYWTEGRSSHAAVLEPGKPLYTISARDGNHPIYLEEQQVEETADEYRSMTPAEEVEWAQARLTAGA